MKKGFVKCPDKERRAAVAVVCTIWCQRAELATAHPRREHNRQSNIRAWTFCMASESDFLFTMETYSVNSSFDNFLAYLDFFIIIILNDLIYYLHSKVWIRYVKNLWKSPLVKMLYESDTLNGQKLVPVLKPRFFDNAVYFKRFSN